MLGYSIGRTKSDIPVLEFTAWLSGANNTDHAPYSKAGGCKMVGDKVKFYAGIRGYLVGVVVKAYIEQGCYWFDVETNQGIFTVPPDQCDYLDI